MKIRPNQSVACTALFALVGLVLVQNAPAVASENATAAQSTPSLQGAPDFHFGGYRWFGSTSEISAAWRVPRIAYSSNVGHASTWIGVQPMGGGAPFIQLGTLEDDPALIGTDPPSTYHVFWSDVAVGFHPQILGIVHAGDAVSARMSAVSNGWRLTFIDGTSHLTLRKKVTYGNGVVPTQAEWFQEDPSDTDENPPSELPYPDMSDVGFSSVKVNGGVPSLGLNNGQVLLSSTGHILVPGTFRGDEFALSAPTGLPKQYLVIADREDQSSTNFDQSISDWSRLSSQDRRSSVETEVVALTQNVDHIHQLPIPQEDRATFAAFENHLELVRQDLRAWGQSGLSLSSERYHKYLGDAQTTSEYSDPVREDLGLPPP